MDRPEHRLIDAILLHDWDKARSLVRLRNAHRLVEYNFNGYNALHKGHRVPLDIWMAMLDASTRAPLQRDTFGSLPLHQSFKKTSSDEKVLALIDACPRTVAIADRAGESPLRIALWSNRSLEIIHRLLKAKPSTLTETQKDSDTDLQSFFRMWNMNLRDSLSSMGNNHSISDLAVRVDRTRPQTWVWPNGRKEVKIKEVHDKAVLLLRVATHGTVKDLASPFQPLHASIIISQCPWSIFNMILIMDYTQIHECNEEGNFPIHIAAATKSSFDGELYKCESCKCKFNSSPWFQLRREYAEDEIVPAKSCKKCTDINFEEDFFLTDPVDKIPLIIKDLLEANPEVANFPNQEGRLPLTIAVENDKSFEEGGVKTIFQASPISLSTPDIATHLYPFMLSAVEHDESTERKKDEPPSVEFLQKFSCCFALLMENPVLVSSGIPKKGYKRKQKAVD